MLVAHQDKIHQLGVGMRQVGDTAFLIESIPPFLHEGDVERLLHEMLKELQDSEQERSVLDKMAATLSRRSRFAKRLYLQEETVLIVQKLMQTLDPLFCPQGKRTLFHIREDDIEKYFSSHTAR
jgi:DNA mismatch repair protein MutL